MFHADFAQIDKEFRAACERAKVKPTRRQASKWRRKFGSAYKERPTVGPSARNRSRQTLVRKFTVKKGGKK